MPGSWSDHRFNGRPPPRGGAFLGGALLIFMAAIAMSLAVPWE